MARTKKNKKMQNDSKQYNAENEIIIGVTTKPKEKRVEKKSTRPKKQINKEKNKKQNKKTQQYNYKRIKTESEIKKSKRRKTVMSVCILIIIIFAGMIYYLTTPTFNISNIVIGGNDKISIEEYINLTEIKLNETNIYQITKNQIEKRLKTNAYVDSVEVKRRLPNTIQLIIKERRTCFQVSNENQYIYIDNQGYILESSDTKIEVPILIGLESFYKEEITVGERLIEDDLYKINTIFKVMNYLKNNNIQNEITSIDVSDSSNYIFNMDKDEKIIYLGDASNISERMNLLKSILEREKGKKGKIFMNGNPNKDDVYFREEK